MKIFSSMQSDMLRKAELLILRSYMDNIDRLASPGYVQNDQDILRSCAHTVGILHTEFNLPGLKLSVVDVDGTRSQRKKWVHVFEGAHCLAFVAALSGYDECLVKDRSAVRDIFDIIPSLPLLRPFLII